MAKKIGIIKEAGEKINGGLKKRRERRKHMKRNFLVALCLSVVFILILSSSAIYAQSTPKAKEKEKYGIAFLGDLTGPLGFWNAPRLVGIQDAAEYLNKHHGGIANREIVIDWADTKSKIDIATSGYERLKANKFPVWHTCGTGEQQMLKPRYEEDRSQVIFTCSTSPGVMYPPGYVFGTAAYYPDEWGLFFDWLVETWDFKKMGRGPKVAILTYSSGYGKACITDELFAYAKKKGVEIVDTIFVPFVVVDAATPLLKAKKAGADWCFGQWIYQSVPPFLIENQKLDLGLKFAVNTFGVDDVMITMAKEASIGLTGITNWTLPSENTPGMKIIRETLDKKFRRPEDRGASYILGWMNTWQTKMVVEQTLKRVGKWEKVTPTELRKTAETWKKVDINGLGIMEYGLNQRGVTESRIVQVQKVKVGDKEELRWVALTDMRKVPRLVPPEWEKPLPY
jgi:ABC-type branched-subunit amino acid transport system substrate-binding protein